MHQNYDATIANLNIDKDTRVIYQGMDSICPQITTD
jgi:hypothetical protein